jgi:hypothetical protein
MNDRDFRKHFTAKRLESEPQRGRGGQRRAEETPRNGEDSAYPVRNDSLKSPGVTTIERGERYFLMN